MGPIHTSVSEKNSTRVYMYRESSDLHITTTGRPFPPERGAFGRYFHASRFQSTVVEGILMSVFLKFKSCDMVEWRYVDEKTDEVICCEMRIWERSLRIRFRKSIY